VDWFIGDDNGIEYINEVTVHQAELVVRWVAVDECIFMLNCV